MEPAQLKAAALALPGAYEDFPFGPESSVFKIRPPISGGAKRVDKMFALVNLGAAPLALNLKCDPELAVQLRLAHQGIMPGYHMSKKHWNTVDCSQMPDQMVLDMLEDSYDLVVCGLPRKQQEALGWSAAVREG